jgi:glucose/arabinose dehydrogenase
MKRRFLLIVFALAAVVAFAASAVADPSVTVVMSGLDNPRGLTFGPQGALYVAEAGRGGAGLDTRSASPDHSAEPAATDRLVG